MRRFYYLILVAVLLLGGFIPFETISVPKWKIKIIDSNDAPMKNVEVVQFCENYTLSVDPCIDAPDRFLVTDESGLVEFPERRIRMNFWLRVYRTIVNLVLVLAHGSYGTDTYVLVYGPAGTIDFKYTPTASQPHIFKLPK